VTLNQKTSAIGIDLRAPAPEADCLDCLVAVPAAVDMMRAAEDGGFKILNSLISHTRDSFQKLDVREDSGIKIVAASAQDILYRHVARLSIMDRYTRIYFEQAVWYFFTQLTSRGVRTFYILDNSLQDDRLGALLQLFDTGGVATITPPRDGSDWPSLSKQILAGLETVGHAAYIEPNSEVNHIEAAKVMARSLKCVATFRNLAPDDPAFEVIRFVT